MEKDRVDYNIKTYYKGYVINIHLFEIFGGGPRIKYAFFDNKTGLQYDPFTNLIDEFLEKNQLDYFQPFDSRGEHDSCYRYLYTDISFRCFIGKIKKYNKTLSKDVQLLLECSDEWKIYMFQKGEKYVYL